MLDVVGGINSITEMTGVTASVSREEKQQGEGDDVRAAAVLALIPCS